MSFIKDTRRVELPDGSTRELTKGEMHAFVAIVGGANSWSRLAARLDKKLSGILPKFLGGRKKKP